MNDNLNIWKHACKTDISATKPDKNGGYVSTAINKYWHIRKATELWGPIGTEWGYDILEEVFQDGVPLLDKETKAVLCMSQMHTIKLRVWYPGSKDSGVVNYGHTPYVYNSKYGPICDMEAPKKSLTDALGKCLSFLGFSADVFMGEFDNPEYLEERAAEEALELADNKDEEKEKQESEYREWFSSHLELIKSAQSLNELETLFKLMYRKMQRRGDEAGIKKAVLTKDNRKNELEKK